MSTPLTDAIEALTTYANETTGASDTTLSDAVGTLVDGYGQGGGDDFLGQLSTYEIEVESDTYSISVSDTYTWAPQFVAFIAETPHVVPASTNAIISGMLFKGGERATSQSLTNLTNLTTMYSNGGYDYWTSWGNASTTTSGVTITITRTGVGMFIGGQKIKILVFETTDYFR